MKLPIMARVKRAVSSTFGGLMSPSGGWGGNGPTGAVGVSTALTFRLARPAGLLNKNKYKTDVFAYVSRWCSCQMSRITLAS